MPTRKSTTGKAGKAKENTDTPKTAGKDNNLIYVNGIDATTGNYLIPPMDEHDTAQIALNQATDKKTANMLGNVARKSTEKHLGGAFDLDLEDITQAGWAVVFHKDESADVKKALGPLIEHRKKGIGNDDIVKVLEYRDGDTVVGWLARNKVGFGPVDPEKVPFYVLLVGGPDKIPFSFGQLLDAVYAVGRLHFDDLSGYQRYVDSLIRYEKEAKAPTGKDVVFWGPRNKNDRPTMLSSEYLIKPLASGAKSVIERASKSAKVVYKSKLIEPAGSTKENLLEVLNPGAGKLTPALLFTASHGIGWPNGHANQLPAQGALLCQNFPGLGLGPLKPGHYLAASDLAKDARVWGMVAFNFACYSVGTPDKDRFSYKPGTPPPDIAPKPFFSALSKALLSHPNGSALGVIGHVERAWQNSIMTEGVGQQIQAFENSIGYILTGLPLGYALKDFNERFAVQSANLTTEIDKANGGKPVPDRQLAQLWLERNDAEGYLLFGDPGACLRKDKLQ